MNFLPVQI